MILKYPNNLNFSNSLTVDGSSTTNIFVRFSPTEVEIQNGNLLFESSGAGNANVSLRNSTSWKYNYRTFSNQRIAWGGGHGHHS